MDTTKLKNFAPAARHQLIQDVTTRLDWILTGDSVEHREHAKAISQLKDAIAATGREALIEQVAYTWFNRLCALRYMDANAFTRTRVVSPADGATQPEVLAEAKSGFFDRSIEQFVDQQKVKDLLAGRITSKNAQSDAYRLLLIAACNALHDQMPFMFEQIDDYSELLMPEDLLSEYSIISQVVDAMTDDACQNIEIIGWLYQFYISEKKDQVIGKVVKSEDIPAATQLFTPNWIVKYMVQNSLGGQWMSTYPDSPLKGQMEYYIEPAEQTDEVNTQLAAITPSQLNPEELTLIDPASGSGHILVEAYELFKAIYLERGYRRTDVPQLILEKNLYGLDIDERAAQLTGFALMMKGRADDRRLFERGVKLNVMAMVDSAGFDAEAAASFLHHSRESGKPDFGLQKRDLTNLKRLFEHATTFGSLIQVPEGLAPKLPALKQLSNTTSQDLFVSEALKRLEPLVQQAELLAAQYDAVVANPPYIGSKFHVPVLKKFLKDHYKGYEKDVFSAFIDRDLAFSKPHGRLGFMSPFVWMFISSFEQLRTRLINNETVTSLVQLEYSGFEGATVPICTFTLQKRHVNGEKSCFIRLSEFRGAENQGPKTLEAIEDRRCGWFFEAAQDDFKKIPGSPVAYWVSDRVLDVFETNESLARFANPNQALVTGNTDRHIRCWWEIPLPRIGFGFSNRESAKRSAAKWFPYNKGGPFRNWYGNYWFVVNWENDGHELRTTKHPTSDRIWAHNFVLEQIFNEALVWAKITSGPICFRYSPDGFLFDDASGVCPSISREPIKRILAFLVTPVARLLAGIASPTLNMQPGDLASLPYSAGVKEVDPLADALTTCAQADWDSFETSWDFQSLPLLTVSSEPTATLESSYTAWITQNRDTIAEMKRLEEENNRLFIDAYGLADELTPDVPIEQITLTVNPAYRYGGKLTIDAQWARFRQDTMEELVSYAIGCMMGRYSLDAPGLIYAHSGNEGFDPSKYTSFPADDDSVIPFLDEGWFEDDVVERFNQFLRVTFGEENFSENLRFLENALGKDIRSYLLKDFYKAHVKTYKKRPIYWMFSSPKGSFKVLIYLHRYRPDTVSVILNDYLRNYRDKLQAQKSHLEGVSISPSVSAAEKTRILKQLEKLKAVLTELEEYERDIIFPLAQQQIEIDLDDGVKQNYPKFGKALTKVVGLSAK